MPIPLTPPRPVALCWQVRQRLRIIHLSLDKRERDDQLFSLWLAGVRL